LLIQQEDPGESHLISFKNKKQTVNTSQILIYYADTQEFGSIIPE